MKEIVVVSGKGGTGKTSFSLAGAYFLKNKVLADADVDGANFHILINPEVKTTEDYFGGKKYFINADRCIKCGKCFDVCQFGAVEKNNSGFAIKGQDCEGCGVCALVCPVGCIGTQPAKTGYPRFKTPGQ